MKNLSKRMSTVVENHQFNNSNLFRNATECPKPVEIEFRGEIPSWLKGRLYRNGPGRFDLTDDRQTSSVQHPFDGFAFIHKYDFDGQINSIRFQSQFIKSRTYEESMRNGHLITRQFGSDPCKTIFGRFQLLFNPLNPQTYPDDPSVSIQRVNKELIALTETVTGYIIDENSLETVAPLVTLPFTKPLRSEILTLTTAHVLYDQKRRMTVSYAVRMTQTHGHWLDVVFIYEDPQTPQSQSASASVSDEEEESFEDGRFTLITRDMNERGRNYNRLIRSNTKSFRYDCRQGASYMHSASITENFLILTEIPLHFSLWRTIGTILQGDLLTNMFKWNESLPTYFRVIRLDNGEEVARIPGPSFFTFHHINAYENNADEIIIDLCAYDDHRLVEELCLRKVRENIFPSGLGYLRRFHLNLKTNRCQEPSTNTNPLPMDEQIAYPISHRNSLVPVQFDLPRINLDHQGQLYRYIYAVRGPPNRLMDALIKIDVQSRQISSVWEEPSTSPSEPIFVPNPEKKKEDDGIILTVVFEQMTNKSFLLLLDASTFKEITRAYLPAPIPFSLHGNFY